MMVSSMLLHATHVDDSDHGRKGPFISFWGVQEEQGLLMANYITAIKHKLQSRAPPSSASELNNQPTCWVLINNEWKRAKVSETVLSSLGTLDVFCIDSGESHSIPLSFVRTVDMTEVEAHPMWQSPPLARKFIIADVVVPLSSSQWSIPAMLFLKNNLENHTWKAVHLSNDAESPIVRIFDLSNQLFVTSLIQKELGLPSQTYEEALSMSKVLNGLANTKPVSEPAQSTSRDPASPRKTANCSSQDPKNSPECDISPPLPKQLTSVEILDLNSEDASVRLEDSSVCLTPTKTASENEYIFGDQEDVGSDDDKFSVYLGCSSSPNIILPPEPFLCSPVSLSGSDSDVNPDSVQQNVPISTPKSAREETDLSIGDLSSSSGSLQPPSPIVEPLPPGVADNLPAEYLPLVADRNPFVANLLNTLLRSPRQTELVPTPSSLNKELMPHQRWGLSYMLWRESEVPSGGCFSHLGFEKHLCIVALLLHDKEKLTAQVGSKVISPWQGPQRSRATLILCPKDAMETWNDQISSFSSSLTVASYFGKEMYIVPKRERNTALVRLGKLHQFDVVIAAYETVCHEISVLKIDDASIPILDFDPKVDDRAIRQSILLQIGFNRIILDDSEMIRDPSKNVSQAVCRIRAVHRWAVTATPFRDLDWFPLFRFLRVQPFCDLETLNSWLNEGEHPLQRLKLLISTLNLTRVPVLPDNRLELYSLGLP